MRKILPSFTICIPTFRRGKRVLHVVETLLPQMEPDWELLVLNNASDQEQEYYQRIELLAKQNEVLTYFQHEKNGLFHGNYLACFENAQAPFFMVVSDEDIPNLEMIRNVLPYLKKHPEVGVYRGSMEPWPGVTPRNSICRRDIIFASGNEAMLNYGLANNYVSGTIYNNNIVKKYGLLEKLKNGIDRNKVYPHLYMELFFCAVSSVVTSSKIICFEGDELITGGGDPEVDGIEDKRGKGPSDYLPPYSFGSRIDQLVILRDSIREAVDMVRCPFDHSLFVNMYLELCDKYFRLISNVNSSMYLSYSLHPGMLQQSFFYMCAASISVYPEYQNIEDKIYDQLQNIYEKYELYPGR